MAKCEVFLGLISFTGGDGAIYQCKANCYNGRRRLVRIRACTAHCLSRAASLALFGRVATEIESLGPPGVLTWIRDNHRTGRGRAEITGRFVVDPPRDPFDYHFSLTYLVAKRPGINPPASLAKKGFDWRKGWSDSWFKSQEGGVYLNTLHHWFVEPDPDGKFRISGVPPGEYLLAVNLYGTTEGCLVHPGAARDADIGRGRSADRRLGQSRHPHSKCVASGRRGGQFRLRGTRRQADQPRCAARQSCW